MKRTLRIGTRGSALALWQAHHARDLLLAADAGLSVEIKVIKTKGDRIQDRSLADIGGKGLFVKEIQRALLVGDVDISVHSLKDYPAENPDGLAIVCTPERADRRDALVCPVGGTEEALPSDAVVGTGSLRRRYQLAVIRREWRSADLRGNVETRLRRVDEGDMDATVLAVAGLKRLGKQDRITRAFSVEEMIPAAGQGTVAVECRSDDAELVSLLTALRYEDTWSETEVERHFLSRLGASCTTPVGFTALVDGDAVSVHGFLASLDGSRHVRGSLQGAREEGRTLADSLCETFEAQGFSF